MRVRDNVLPLFIYILDIYSTLFVAQAISKAEARAPSRLACTPSRLGLYSKLPKGSTLCLKVPPLLCDNFLEASRTKTNTVIYNQGLILGLNCMLKGYVHDTSTKKKHMFLSISPQPQIINL
jgi:hypothetical protein